MLLKMKPDVGAVSKKLTDFEGKCIWHCGIEQYTELAPATCLLVRRELAMFDEGFKGYYMEDIALCKKIRGLGFKIAVENLHPIKHFGRGTFERLDNQSELISVNDVYFREKYQIPLDTSI